MLTRLQDLLPQASEKRGLTRRLRVAHLFNAYQDAVHRILGPRFAGKTRASFVKGSCLWVEGMDSMVCSEIQRHSELILQHLGRSRQHLAIESMRVRLSQRQFPSYE